MSRNELTKLWYGTTILAAVGSLKASAALAYPVEGRYVDHYGMMGWGGWFYGPVMMLLFFALLVGAVVLVVRLLGSDSLRSGEKQEDRAHVILRERFAKGEITKEEFEESRKVLDGGAS
ncbi:SHOCT domain-containing protein [Sedimentitalea sp. JM2-8]|uniref:SHOCT domain-containing protein n=1 Tax=Sedimentitalea xiamensis TaxID=3050037 RepID=A0ABT7FFC5_9RHOB|nr:SHOCT domain-containing protein [Sedimentitalea xiamensis]MDK3073817.1 SHOCT domain-containing protein [Sedimentitalea xiamensis]